MQLVVFLPQSWHVNIVQSIQASSVVHLLRLQYVSPHHEPLRRSQPILHRQQLSVGRLARHLLHYVGHLLRGL